MGPTIRVAGDQDWDVMGDIFVRAGRASGPNTEITVHCSSTALLDGGWTEPSDVATIEALSCWNSAIGLALSVS